MHLIQAIDQQLELLTESFGAAWLRGEQLAATGAVIRIDQRDLDAVQGSVRGSHGNVYSTRVFLGDDDGDIQPVLGECSCPVAIDCKHVAALIHYLVRPASTQALRPTTPLARVEPPSRWHALASSGQLTVPGVEARDATQLLVLLRETRQCRVLLRPVRARIGKSGRFAHVRKVDLSAPRILQTLHAWAMPERLAALALMAFDGIEYLDEEPWLFFDAGIDALIAQLFTLGIPLRLEGVNGVALRQGDARPMATDWQVAANGSQILALHVQPRALPIANAHYRLYLDDQNGEIGAIISEVPVDTIAAIAAMPAVQPDEIESANRALSRLFPTLDLPKPQALTIVDAAPIVPTAIVLIGGAPYMNRPDLLTQATAHLGFRYGQIEVRAGDAASELRWRGENGRVHALARDKLAETRASDFLRRHGFRPGTIHGFGTQAEHWYWSGRLKDAELSRWVNDLRRDAAASRIELRSADEFPIALEPEIGELALAVDSEGNDWFSLRLGIEVDGQPIDLVPVLLEALARPEELRPEGLRLTLPDGRRVFIANDRLKPLLDLIADLEVGEGGKLGLPRARIAALDPAPDWRFMPSPEAAEFMERVRAFRGIQACPPPPGFRAELRPYQQEGLAWLAFLHHFQFGGVLADDMGLGKTVQVLAHVLALKQQGELTSPVLVLCPTSVVDNWRAETERFAPDLNVIVLAGAERHDHFPVLSAADVVVTSYALLWRDIEQLKLQRFTLAVFDEAQWLKNAASRSHGAAAQLDSARRLCLTGTPVENHLGELKAQFDLAFPGLLGTNEQFRTRFRQPIERERDLDASERLRKRIAPFLLRRRKSEVAKDLPARTLIVHPVELEGAQRDLYETVRVQMEARVREALGAHGFGASQITILDALLKLRQICCDPRLIEAGRKVEDITSAKLDALMDLLPTLVDEGRSVLVFSQFTRMLDLIQEALIEKGITYARLDGSTKRRDIQVARFQDAQVPVFLISLKAGGVGLNLTRADTVILYDPWWNPAAEAQAIDRAHRIGQDKPVFIYEMQCRGTVEERMNVLKQKKREIADSVLEHGEATLSALAADDLLKLFDA